MTTRIVMILSSTNGMVQGFNQPKMRYVNDNGRITWRCNQQRHPWKKMVVVNQPQKVGNLINTHGWWDSTNKQIGIWQEKTRLIWVQYECELLPAWGSAHWKSHLVFWAISQRFHETMTVCYPFQRSNFWLVGKAGAITPEAAWLREALDDDRKGALLVSCQQRGRWEDGKMRWILWDLNQLMWV